MHGFLYIHLLVFVFLSNTGTISAQETIDSAKLTKKKPADLDYIDRYDTIFHVQTWVSKHQMNYRLIYTDDFKLILAPNKTNSLSFGFSYRYLDLGMSFSPGFLNPGQNDTKKGESEIFSFRTAFSM